MPKKPSFTGSASAILSLISPTAVRADLWQANGKEFHPHNHYTIILTDYDSFDAARVTLAKFGKDAVAVASVVGPHYIDIEIQFKDEATDSEALHFYNGLPDKMPRPVAQPVPSGFHYILIDPDNRTVTSYVAPEHVKPTDCYAFFRPVLGCQTIETIGRSADLQTEVLLVDENAGCYSDQPTPWRFNGKIILGKAVLIGVRGNYFAACKRSVPEVTPQVTFDTVPRGYRHDTTAQLVVLPGLPGNPLR